MTTIGNHDELRAVYRPAKGVPLEKVIHSLDDQCIDFLAKSPFMVLSSSDADGAVDGSPKGGEPGFARVLDDGRVAWADLSGNNRLDSFENIVTHPKVALLFMIPGLNETLRINGDAELSTDETLCDDFAQGDRPAKVVVTVTVDEAYVHCNKAMRRSELWSPNSWLSNDELPNAVKMYKSHAAEGLQEMSVGQIETILEDDVQATMWVPGGTEPGNASAT